eukprot:15287028-Alexandrium_andersonii.AAC.1
MAVSSALCLMSRVSRCPAAPVDLPGRDRNSVYRPDRCSRGFGGSLLVVWRWLRQSSVARSSHYQGVGWT